MMKILILNLNLLLNTTFAMNSDLFIKQKHLPAEQKDTKLLKVNAVTYDKERKMKKYYAQALAGALKFEGHQYKKLHEMPNNVIETIDKFLPLKEKCAFTQSCSLQVSDRRTRLLEKFFKHRVPYSLKQTVPSDKLLGVQRKDINKIYAYLPIDERKKFFDTCAVLDTAMLKRDPSIIIDVYNHFLQQAIFEILYNTARRQERLNDPEQQYKLNLVFKFLILKINAEWIYGLESVHARRTNAFWLVKYLQYIMKKMMDHSTNTYGEIFVAIEADIKQTEDLVKSSLGLEESEVRFRTLQEQVSNLQLHLEENEVSLGDLDTAASETEQAEEEI